MTKHDLSGSEEMGTNAHRYRKNLLLPFLGLILGVILLLIAWWIATRPTLEEELGTFFENEVHPQLAQYSKRNQEAVNRAVERISIEINEYGEGIPAFVEDVTSLGTKFGVFGRWWKDRWKKGWGNDPVNATHLQEYMSGKFEEHLFSDQDLKLLIQETLEQFRDDLKANQNRLHADVTSAWKLQPYAQGDLHLEQVVAEVDQNIKSLSHKMGTDSLTNGVLAFVGDFVLGGTAGGVANAIIVYVSANLVSSTAFTSAVSGGVIMKLSVAGGAGGSTLGPVGTVVGAAAGIIVGGIADWWMTKNLEEELTNECNSLLSQVKAQLLMGTKDAPGLQQAFLESISILEEAEESALRKSIMEVTK